MNCSVTTQFVVRVQLEIVGKPVSGLLLGINMDNLRRKLIWVVVTSKRIQLESVNGGPNCDWNVCFGLTWLEIFRSGVHLLHWM